MSTLTDWVRLGKERGASDIHLEPGTPLVLRVRGELSPMGEPIPADALLQVTQQLLGSARWREFLERRSADLSQTIVGARCRINAFQTARGVSLAIRLLSSFRNNVRDSNLHPDIRRFIEPETGLVIVSGPTGSGKSTTLAALIEEINGTRRRHILTIESPIEYFFANRQSFIRQREVQSHTPSFEQAITDAMREDPDILVIGEMRTHDVMRLTLNSAETGHLVLATMHSSTCAEALNRICMSFPSEIQNTIRAQLADCLVGVICQRLAYIPQLQIQVPHCEILVANSAVRSLIRSGQFSQIVSAIQTGGEEGMWSFDRYQRWIDQNRDWVKPSQAAPLEERREVARGLDPALEAPPTPTRKLPAERPPVATKAPARRFEPSDEEGGGGGRIEIPDAEDDLTELAKQISKKTTEPEE